MSFEQETPACYEGDTPAACAARLADAGADIVGVNCLNGPEQQLAIAKEMRGAVSGYVASQPVAYRTTNEMPDFTSFEAFPYEFRDVGANTCTIARAPSGATSYRGTIRRSARSV
jgi:methionine synthase I (cobalamin-dependent)